MRLKVKEVAEQLGIENANQLAALTGLGLASVYKMWSGEIEMISLDTINTLCRSLGTQPAALFEYTPDKDTGGSSLLERIARVQKVKRGRPRKNKLETHPLPHKARAAVVNG